jgi:HTH-type transcriptional regulator/antitoxin MqsA
MARRCRNCEGRKGLTRFDGETILVEHAGQRAKVEGLSGWRCGACGEVEFDPESARRYATAGDALVLRERQSKEIRRIRRKLGLTQVAAARAHRRRPQRVLPLRTRRGASSARRH